MSPSGGVEGFFERSTPKDQGQRRIANVESSLDIPTLSYTIETTPSPEVLPILPLDFIPGSQTSVNKEAQHPKRLDEKLQRGTCRTSETPMATRPPGI